LRSRLERLRPQLAAKAQERYDNWNQDEEGHDEVMGVGGICHEIAELFGEVIGREGIDTVHIHWDDVNHVACIAYNDEEGWIVDMPCGLYETGGGYRWRKKRGVEFEPSDITISRISRSDVQGILDYGM
jgi:hypothetical protein